MSNMEKVYASNSNWVPVSGSYKLDSNLNLYTDKVVTIDGYSGYKQHLFSDTSDTCINKHTIFHLPQVMNLSNFLYDKGKKDGTFLGGYNYISTIINDSVYYIGLNESKTSLMLTDNIDEAIYINFRYNGNDTYSLYNGVNKMITVSKNEPLNLYLDFPLQASEKYRQEFIIEKYHDDQIVIFAQYNSGTLRRWAYRTEVPNKHIVRANGLINNTLSVFKIDDLNNSLKFELKGFELDHHFITYFNQINNKENRKNVKINTKEITDIQYLVDNPYHNINYIDQDMPINIANLKSVMVGEYKYKMNNREYNKLFFGKNEDSGYNKPLMSFNSLTKQIIFYTDINNNFEYPQYSDGMSITSIPLIENGAMGNVCPSRSDYINYADDCIPYDSNVKNISGTYLCTWLYTPLSSNEIKWVDRWYNPYILSKEEAFNCVYGMNIEGIKDEDSIFILENGIKYNYFHYGNYTNQLNLKEIDKNCIIHFENWKNENFLIQENCTIKSDQYLIINRDIPLIEKPINNTIVNSNDNKQRPENKIDEDYILDMTEESSYVGAQFSNTITNKPGNFSVSVAMRSDNWKYGNTHHLISNGFRSGWNLKLNIGFYNPLIVLMTKNGKIIVYSIEGLLIFDVSHLVAYDLSHTISEIDSYVVEDNLMAKILGKSIDDSNWYVFTVDLTTGIIIEQDETIISSGNKILFDENKELQITPNNEYYNLNNMLIFSENKNDIDNFNNLWEIKEDGIYRNDILVTNINAIELKCSNDDKLWVICEIDDIYYLNVYDISDMDNIIQNSDVLSFNKTATSREVLDITDENVILDLYYTTNGTEAVIIDKTNNNIYKTNYQGKIVFSSLLLNENDEILYNDLTTYTWYRKFNYIKNNRIPQLELEFYTDEGNNLYKILYPVNNLVNKEWHYFGFSIDQNNKIATLYMDTQLLESVEYDGSNIYYIYETPILIGTGSGKNDVLAKENKNNVYDYFIGYIDDFRYYDSVLTQSDFRCIYTHKFRYKDLFLNLPLSQPIYYIEEIERFFKFKLPGSKSAFFNIKLSGLDVKSIETRNMIETIIRNTIRYVAPAYTELYKITWVE